MATGWHSMLTPSGPSVGFVQGRDGAKPACLTASPPASGLEDLNVLIPNSASGSHKCVSFSEAATCMKHRAITRETGRIVDKHRALVP
jgi:hypothetical protein